MTNQRVSLVRRVLVLGCSATKRQQAGDTAPAVCVYDGPSWRVYRKWKRDHPVKAFDVDVYALSARYGLIPSSWNIRVEYDQKMTAERSRELIKDATQQQRALDYVCDDGVGGLGDLDILFFGSELYAKTLDGLLPAGFEYRRCGDGTARGIGDQLHELREWLDSVTLS